MSTTQQGQFRIPIEPPVEAIEEPEDVTNRRRLLASVAFVVAVAAVSLLVYLFLRPANRHLEPTPYDGIVSQLRSSMSPDDVLGLYRASSEGVQRGEIAEYDESAATGSHHVLTYRIGGEEPLKVRFGGAAGRELTDWCFRDHCHDNIE